MSTCLEEDDDSYDSVGEEAELELSCALHDLALRVKSFEENMRDRFHAAIGDDDGDEITEDIPEMDGDHSAASPKTSARGGRSTLTQQIHRQRASRGGAKSIAKQQPDEDDEDMYVDDDDDEEEDGGYDSDDEDSAEDDTQSGEKQQKSPDWDFQEQKEELSEMRHNIALLLQGMKAEAKALESRESELPHAADDNQ